MRSIVVGWFGVMLFALNSMAQVNLGIGAGLNFGELGDINIQDVQTTYEQSTGYHVGAFLDIGLGMMALRPGVYYLNAGPLFKGATFLQANQLPDDFDVIYISVPVDLRLQVPLPLVKPYLFGGPELRYYVEGNEPEELKDDMQGQLILGNVGVGVQVHIPLLGLSLYPEARYAFGVSGVTQQTIDIGDEVYEVEKQTFKSFMIRLGVGW